MPVACRPPTHPAHLPCTRPRQPRPPAQPRPCPARPWSPPAGSRSASAPRSPARARNAHTCWKELIEEGLCTARYTQPARPPRQQEHRAGPAAPTCVACLASSGVNQRPAWPGTKRSAAVAGGWEGGSGPPTTNICKSGGAGRGRGIGEVPICRRRPGECTAYVQQTPFSLFKHSKLATNSQHSGTTATEAGSRRPPCSLGPAGCPGRRTGRRRRAAWARGTGCSRWEGWEGGASCL